MYEQVKRRSAVLVSVLAVALATAAWPRHAVAQAANEHAGHEHMPGGDDGSPPATREGSGTSWLPDESPMYAIHRPAGQWMVMLHTSVFLQYLRESGNRGGDATGSINWFMAMADRKAGAGRVMLRAMASAEPWTIDACGYPNALATGERCDTGPLHDRQHPHDLFMELAARYDRPIAGGIRLQLYGGPAGEPALGPVAFMHRVSGLFNPIAPVTHHWFDSTHVTFGVATAGVYGNRWKAEASVFNGREPDERRKDFDFGAMDSYSGRFWFLPTSRWSLQVSAGHLHEAEGEGIGTPRLDVDRVTASATYHRTTLERTWWATTVGWGRNAEQLEQPTQALFGETSLTFNDRDVFYGRAEWSQKTDGDLVTFAPGIHEIVKLQGGYTRYLGEWNRLVPGIGAGLSTGIVPASLVPEYGGRANLGVSVYVTLRPASQE